jgi:hypothetical protein
VKIIGVLMLIAPFVVIFAGITYDHGVLVALAIFTAVGVFVLWVLAATWFLKD